LRILPSHRLAARDLSQAISLFLRYREQASIASSSAASASLSSSASSSAAAGLSSSSSASSASVLSSSLSSASSSSSSSRWRRGAFRELNLLREGLIDRVADFVHLYRDALQWLTDAQRARMGKADAPPSDAAVAFRCVFAHGDALL
jgi:hypothetical protein